MRFHQSVPSSSDRIWTAAFLSVCITQLCINLAQSMFNNGFALYIDSLGGDTVISGLGAACFAFVAGLGRILSGALADQYSPGIVMRIGGGLFSLATLAFLVFHAVPAVLILRSVQGMGFAFLSTAAATAAASTLPPARLGEGIGYYGVGNSVGTAIGPPLVISIIVMGHYSRMFIAIALVILAGTACILPFYPAIPRCPSAHQKHPFPSWKDSLEPMAFVPGLLMLLCAAAFSSAQNFLALFAELNGIPYGGFFFTVAAGSIFVIRLLSGKVLDRRGAVVAVLPGCAFGILSNLILAAKPGFLAYLFSGICYGVANGTALPALSAISVQRSPIHRRGSALATFYLFLDIGMGVGGAFWGKVQAMFGFRAVFLGSAACLLTVGLLTVLLLKSSTSSRV